MSTRVAVSVAFAEPNFIAVSTGIALSIAVADTNTDAAKAWFRYGGHSTVAVSNTDANLYRYRPRSGREYSDTDTDFGARLL